MILDKIIYNGHGKKILVESLTKGSNAIVNVECEYCGTRKLLSIQKYFKNTKDKTVKYSCSNKCSVNKYKDTCMERYGVDNAYKLQANQDKFKKTCLEIYGVNNPMLDKNISNKMRDTKIEIGLYSDGSDEYKKYNMICRTQTNKIRKQFLLNWDGYDYYDNEYIRDNFSLHPMDRRYPTVDHRISILFGFLNSISTDIICDISNLCFTKRYINSSMGAKTNKRKL